MGAQRAALTGMVCAMPCERRKARAQELDSHQGCLVPFARRPHGNRLALRTKRLGCLGP